MVELKEITLIDIVADAREVGGQEYVDLLYRSEPEPPAEDWRLHITLSDGSRATMNPETTAADVAKYLEWARTRRP